MDDLKCSRTYDVLKSLFVLEWNSFPDFLMHYWWLLWSQVSAWCFVYPSPLGNCSRSKCRVVLCGSVYFPLCKLTSWNKLDLKDLDMFNLSPRVFRESMRHSEIFDRRKSLKFSLALLTPILKISKNRQGWQRSFNVKFLAESLIPGSIIFSDGTVKKGHIHTDLVTGVQNLTFFSDRWLML